MFEHRGQPLLHWQAYVLRQARYALFALALVAAALAIGVLGYHALAGMAWVDAFLNAAMILGGMGPIGGLPTAAAKIFAGCYALFSGLAFIVAAGILVAPVVHRFLHHLHLDTEEQDSDPG